MRMRGHGREMEFARKRRLREMREREGDEESEGMRERKLDSEMKPKSVSNIRIQVGIERWGSGVRICRLALDLGPLLFLYCYV